jgi:hypothetical protein
MLEISTDQGNKNPVQKWTELLFETAQQAKWPDECQRHGF